MARGKQQEGIRKKQEKDEDTPQRKAVPARAPKNEEKEDITKLPKPDPNASWTGKFPMALLHEHCQKQGWHKVNYDIKRIRGEYAAATTLASQNPKTKEVETIRFNARADIAPLQPTVVLAKNYAATYALHCISSHKSIHLALPPTFRDYWYKLNELKAALVKEGRAWMYSADPFQTQRERAQEAEEKAKMIAQKAAKPMHTDGAMSTPKVWQNAIPAEMSLTLRSEVEKIVRTFDWKRREIPLSNTQHAAIITDLAKQGFKPAHCEESLEWSHEKEEALEWLLIHVPEDDLPPRYLPPDYTAGEIQFLNVSGDGLKNEYALKRLVAAGYSRDVARETLVLFEGDERQAAEDLFTRLVYARPPSRDATCNPSLDWDEERRSLAAIFGDQFHNINDVSYEIDIGITGCASVSSLRLHCTKPIVSQYPHRIPTLSVFSEPKLPAYIRLSLLRQLGRFADTLKGEMMIFGLVDWIQEHLQAIIDNPGKLKDVSVAVVGIDESQKPRITASMRARPRKKLDWVPGTEESREILRRHEQLRKSAIVQRHLAGRKNLPAWGHQTEIVAAVNSSQIVIISGETGSGKSTQSVQFILDDMIQRELGSQCNIVCTQPRRISALGLADRVAEERGSRAGEEVGYAIRGETKTSKDMRIQFVTTGVLLRRIQMGDTLSEISHIFVDEVHERSLDSDFLLILLKRIIQRRQDIRIILMSATIDAESFKSYFGGGEHIHIEGRTFPVQDFYLEDILARTGYRSARVETNDVKATIQSFGSRIDYDLISTALENIHNTVADGAVLIFLPGVAEINRCIEAINRPEFVVLPLHASLTPSEQRRVFPSVQKKRKVICATNVAETSITIEDVVAVIDTGRVKETYYDPSTKIVNLVEGWASRAACKQRRGRAGRVREGICYKLFTRDLESKLEERQAPEILRTPLEQICIGVKAMGILDVVGFLRDAVTPPAVTAVDLALIALEEMGLLTDDGNLTALGRHLSMIPTDLRCAKLMVFGSIFGCLEETLVLAAILGARSPFISGASRDLSAEARRKFSAGHGDLVTDMTAYFEWRKQRSAMGNWRQWCADNFLSVQTLFDIASSAQQYRDSLAEIGFSVASNDQRAPKPVVCAAIAAGLAPHIAKIAFPNKKYIASATGSLEKDPEARTIKYFSREGSRLFIHPSSTVFAETNFRDAGFASFFTQMETSKLFIRQVTLVNVYSVLFFGGKLEIDANGRGILVAGFRVRAWARIGVLVNRLRRMVDIALEEKIEMPSKDLSNHSAIQIARKLILTNGKQS